MSLISMQGGYLWLKNNLIILVAGFFSHNKSKQPLQSLNSLVSSATILSTGPDTVTILAGKTANLTCTIANLGDKAVSIKI